MADNSVAPAGAPPPSYYPPPVTQQPPSYPPPVSQQPIIMINNSQQQQQQQQQGQGNGGVVRDWSTPMCACMEDMDSCLIVTFCSWFGIAGCIMAHDMGENCCISCCVPGYLTALRTKLRTQLNIPGSICDDCVVLNCWGQYAMCQMWREYKYARAAGLLQ